VRDGLDRCLACVWMLCVAPYGTLEPNGDRTGRWYRNPRESGHGLSPGRRLHARRPARREQPTSSPFPAPNRAGSPPWPPIDGQRTGPRRGPSKHHHDPPSAHRAVIRREVSDPTRDRPAATSPPRPGERSPSAERRQNTLTARMHRHVPAITSPSRRTHRSIDPRRDSPHIQRLAATRTFARPASASAESSDAVTGSRTQRPPRQAPQHQCLTLCGEDSIIEDS
jgi:hypothetical protein